MINYAWDFCQSEMEKYLIINNTFATYMTIKKEVQLFKKGNGYLVFLTELSEWPSLKRVQCLLPY